MSEIVRNPVFLLPGQRMGTDDAPTPWPLPSGYGRDQVVPVAAGPVQTSTPAPGVTVDLVSPYVRAWVADTDHGVVWGAELDAQAPESLTVQVALLTR